MLEAARFTVPYAQHTHFVGRDEDLARLHAALGGGDPVGINPAALGNATGVTGQGGIGKTQLAVEYAYQFQDHYPDGVYWLNAAVDLRQEFAALAEKLGLPLPGTSATSLTVPDRQRLVDLLAGGPWLLGDATARRALLDIAGLGRFAAGLNLNGAAREVAAMLVTRLEPYGFLPDRPTHHALGALLDYLAGLPDTPPDDGQWLSSIIRRYGLIAATATTQSQDERVLAAFAWLREHPFSLLILDNVADPAGLDQPLTRDCVPGRLPCRLLFTTRRRVLGRFRPVELKTLPPDAALALLLRDPRRQPALEPSHLEYATAADICAVLGYLPLAVEIAAAHLSRKPARSLADYRDYLRQHGALDVISGGRVDVATRHEAGLAAALATQWATLGEEARLLLRVAGQFTEAAYLPMTRLGLLAGIDDGGDDFFAVSLADALAELDDASLIEELAGDRARLHPLVREFAHDRTPPTEKDAFIEKCVRRLLTAFSDIGTLERQCDRRGIDALIYDLLAAEVLLYETSPFVVAMNVDLLSYLAVLRREAHNLRGWQQSDAPAFLAQQLHLRLFDSATPNLFGDLAAHLRASGQTWLPRWAARNTSPALEMTLTGHVGVVNAVALTADGRRAVSGGDDGTLRVWNLKTGEVERTLTSHADRVRAVAVTATGRWAVSGGDDGLRLWNLEKGEEERTLTGHVGSVHAVAVTPNGRRAVSGGDDGLRVWNLETDEMEWVTDQAAWVNTVVVTADGRQALSGGLDGILRLWNLDTGKVERTLAGHLNWVNAVSVMADGRWAVSGGRDGIVRVWN